MGGFRPQAIPFSATSLASHGTSVQLQAFPQRLKPRPFKARDPSARSCFWRGPLIPVSRPRHRNSHQQRRRSPGEESRHGPRQPHLRLHRSLACHVVHHHTGRQLANTRKHTEQHQRSQYHPHASAPCTHSIIDRTPYRLPQRHSRSKAKIPRQSSPCYKI